MGFKDWWRARPYWLKGGIIAEGIILLLTILAYIFGFIGGGFFKNDFLFTAFFLIIAIILIPPLFVVETFGFKYGRTGYLGFPDIGITTIIFIIIFYFLIGAIIGWIYGKIKSKKQSQNFK